jgi:glycogen debranching enzyme
MGKSYRAHDRRRRAPGRCMRKGRYGALVLSAAALVLVSDATAQQTPAMAGPPGRQPRPTRASSVRGAPGGVPLFPIPDGPLALTGPARPGHFIVDAGRRAAIFGDETGALEVWAWPLKLVRDLHLAFKIPAYDEPIDGAAVAERTTVRPTAQTIVYSNAVFTVKEHIFVPMQEPGALILLQVETVRPLDVYVRMTADFNLAWPGAFGGQTMAWDGEAHRFVLSQGGVHHYNALIGSPFAVSGTQHPAHNAPARPSQLVLHFDRDAATTDFIPIVIAGGAMPVDSVAMVYQRLLQQVPELFRQKTGHYAMVRDSLLRLHSPDSALDLALEWAKVDLDQQLVCNPDLGCGLVAGFGPAGPGNFRPGFGWFFGGDAAINSLAMDELGEFDLVRQGLEFSAHYQRADGKIPHEISQSAGRLPWFQEYPYVFFHGDTTPFWITACYEYWRASGDDAFVRRLWPKLVKAFRWAASTDSDGDGLMENPSAGAGAIEVGGLGEDLHTDIYLAGIWTESLQGMRAMAGLVGDRKVRRDAGALFQKATASIEREFWDSAAGIYAFALLEGRGATGVGSRPAPGRPDLRVNDALTVWPATALSFQLLEPARADSMLQRLASAAITTDWGTRPLSQYHPLYDPLHYNNGAVWPFVTGFAALAQYRYDRAWAGFDLIRDVARTTFDFARGRNPELLSGAYYRPLDTAVPDQFFATSMLVTPLTRGLLGLEADSHDCTLTVAPQMPAAWDSMSADNFRTGCGTVDVSVHRRQPRPGDRDQVDVKVHRHPGVGPGLKLVVSPALPLGASVDSRYSVGVTRDGVRAVGDVFGALRPDQVRRTPYDVRPTITVPVPLRPAEAAEVVIEFRGGAQVVAPTRHLQVGDRSHALRITDFRQEGDDYVVEVEGVAGLDYDVRIRSITPLVDVRGATLVERSGEITRLSLAVPDIRTHRYAPARLLFRLEHANGQ